MLADGSGDFTRAMGLELDGNQFGQISRERANDTKCCAGRSTLKVTHGRQSLIKSTGPIGQSLAEGMASAVPAREGSLCRDLDG